MPEYIQVVTTTEHREDAESLARAVGRRAAGRVRASDWPDPQHLSLAGRDADTQEWQCWAKSRRDLYDQIERAIRQLHPYEVPEILAMPVLAGSKSYLAWLDEELKGGEQAV